VMKVSAPPNPSNEANVLTLSGSSTSIAATFRQIIVGGFRYLGVELDDALALLKRPCILAWAICGDLHSLKPLIGD
jgi:hypothetical protein